MAKDFESFKDRLSETALKIIFDCEQIAQAMNASADTQHLLLALAGIPGTISYEVLRDAMVSPQRISFLLQSQSSNFKPSKGISEDLKNVLKTAYKEAERHKTPSIDSEHLLLGLVKAKGSNAYLVIQGLGIDPKSLEEQLRQNFEITSGGVGENAEEEDVLSENKPDSLDHFMGPISHEMPRPQRKGRNILDYFTTDLTKMAKTGRLDPVVGRSSEIQRVIQILIRRVKNNPVLTGEPGVGKTAIVEGLSARIASGEVPRKLADKRVLSLDLALLVSGTTYRGQFEERTKRLIEEINKAGNVILFIDELHTIVGAGAAEGSIDMSNILKPSLAKGQLRLIGATTSDEYRKYIEKDPALERRLQKVLVAEPSVEETISILKGLKEAYEKHHNVSITDEAITAAAELAKRYINDRFLPDKAIDLIDEAAAATQLEEKQLKASNKIIDLEKRRKYAHAQHQKAAENMEYKTAAEYRMLELRLETEIQKLKAKLPKRTSTREITREDIARVVSMWTGVPVGSLNRTDKIRLGKLEKTLRTHIIGQDEAISSIAAAIKRSHAGISDPNRPLGSFIFLGPTGVGKTELARVLAREVFGRQDALIKIDMSEFMERHNVSRLVGAPPGYVGFDEAGKLTEAVRRQPYSVILLDEIEKAHPDVFNLLLQVMEDGQITDAKGRAINFRNTILIMTSNLGMAELNRQQAIGFKTVNKTDSASRYDEIKQRINDQLKQEFRPEFLNRLDQVIVFRPLGKTEVMAIVEKKINELSQRLLPEGIEIHIERSAKEFLAEKGFDPEFGARPVRRVITEYIEDPLSEMLLTGKLSKKWPIRILRKGEKLALVK